MTLDEGSPLSSLKGVIETKLGTPHNIATIQGHFLKTGAELQFEVYSYNSRQYFKLPVEYVITTTEGTELTIQGTIYTNAPYKDGDAAANKTSMARAFLAARAYRQADREALRNILGLPQPDTKTKTLTSEVTQPIFSVRLNLTGQTGSTVNYGGSAHSQDGARLCGIQSVSTDLTKKGKTGATPDEPKGYSFSLRTESGIDNSFGTIGDIFRGSQVFTPGSSSSASASRATADARHAATTSAIDSMSSDIGTALSPSASETDRTEAKRRVNQKISTIRSSPDTTPTTTAHTERLARIEELMAMADDLRPLSTSTTLPFLSDIGDRAGAEHALRTADGAQAIYVDTASGEARMLTRQGGQVLSARLHKGSDSKFTLIPDEMTADTAPVELKAKDDLTALAVAMRSRVTADLAIIALQDGAEADAIRDIRALSDKRPEEQLRVITELHASLRTLHLDGCLLYKNTSEERLRTARYRQLKLFVEQSSWLLNSTHSPAAVSFRADDQDCTPGVVTLVLTQDQETGRGGHCRLVAPVLTRDGYDRIPYTHIPEQFKRGSIMSVPQLRTVCDRIMGTLERVEDEYVQFSRQEVNDQLQALQTALTERASTRDPVDIADIRSAIDSIRNGFWLIPDTERREVMYRLENLENFVEIHNAAVAETGPQVPYLGAATAARAKKAIAEAGTTDPKSILYWDQDLGEHRIMAQVREGTRPAIRSVAVYMVGDGSNRRFAWDSPMYSCQRGTILAATMEFGGSDVGPTTTAVAISEAPGSTLPDTTMGLLARPSAHSIQPAFVDRYMEILTHSAGRSRTDVRILPQRDRTAADYAPLNFVAAGLNAANVRRGAPAVKRVLIPYILAGDHQVLAVVDFERSKIHIHDPKACGEQDNLQPYDAQAIEAIRREIKDALPGIGRRNGRINKSWSGQILPSPRARYDGDASASICMVAKEYATKETPKLEDVAAQRIEPFRQHIMRRELSEGRLRRPAPPPPARRTVRAHAGPIITSSRSTTTTSSTASRDLGLAPPPPPPAPTPFTWTTDDPPRFPEQDNDVNRRILSIPEAGQRRLLTNRSRIQDSELVAAMFGTYERIREEEPEGHIADRTILQPPCVLRTEGIFVQNPGTGEYDQLDLNDWLGGDDKEYMLFPLNVGDHWVTILLSKDDDGEIDIEAYNSAEVYDDTSSSMVPTKGTQVSQAMYWLAEEVVNIQGDDFVGTSQRADPGTPKQVGDDCGIHVLMHMDSILRGQGRGKQAQMTPDYVDNYRTYLLRQLRVLDTDFLEQPVYHEADSSPAAATHRQQQQFTAFIQHCEQQFAPTRQAAQEFLSGNIQTGVMSELLTGRNRPGAMVDRLSGERVRQAVATFPGVEQETRRSVSLRRFSSLVGFQNIVDGIKALHSDVWAGVSSAVPACPVNAVRVFWDPGSSTRLPSFYAVVNNGGNQQLYQLTYSRSGVAFSLKPVGQNASSAATEMAADLPSLIAMVTPETH